MNTGTDVKTFQFRKIDAFTDGSSSGNPAGCVYVGENESAGEDEMQKIATQLKGFVNETAFMFRNQGEIRLRYYSSECEVAFCGHATIAIMHNLLKGSPEFANLREIPIRINAGVISVFNGINEENAVYIMAPPPVYHSHNINLVEADRVLFNGKNQIDHNKPLEVIDAGLRTLIIPVVSPDGCLESKPDFEELRSFCIKNNVDIILIFSKPVTNNNCQYRTRVFAPRFGYIEDPATGSGNAAFGYYLIKAGIMPESLMIEQSVNRENPNIIKLRRIRHNDDERIIFGGSSIMRIEGRFHLH